MISKKEWKKIRGSKKEPDHIMLSINGNPESTMTVTWRTDSAIPDGYAEYRELGAEKWNRTVAETGNFVTDVDDSNYHWAHMEGLKPDTKYEYTCGSSCFRSGTYTFKTAPKDASNFKFVVLADTQKGAPTPPPDYSHLGEFIKDILKKHPDTAFILTAGDNTNCGQTDIQWTGLFEGLKGVVEYIPYMMTVGNHDDMGFEDYFNGTGKYYSDKATYFSGQFKGSYPYNGPKDWKTANYTFDYGNAHFAVLGTSGQEYINEWLSDDAAKCKKTWKFGAHHFPVCYAGCNLECEDSYPAMKQGIEKLDLIFSGHEHCFSRSFPRRDDNLYDKPSEGTVHYNCASGHRNPPGTRSMEKCWNSAVYNHEEPVSVYALAEVCGETLTLTSYTQDGRIIDRCVIDKKNDTITPFALAPIYNKTRMKYKGADLGLCSSNTFCRSIDGIWHIPAAVLIQYIGGTVKREAGKMIISVYGITAEFFENSDAAITGEGEKKLSMPVVRADREQLYVPVDSFCEIFKMHYSYFSRNNFLSIECANETSPVPEQP